MKHIIIGDIHGCSAALGNLLGRLGGDPASDRLILLGDLFDRGPDSWGVLQAVKKLAAAYGERFTLLIGNHEDYLLTEKLSFSQRMVWNMVGRRAAVRSFRKHGEKMESCAAYLRENGRLFYRDDVIQCAHAAVIDEAIEKNDRQTLLHDHEQVQKNLYAGRLTVVGHIALDMPMYFAGDGKTAVMLPPGEWMPLPDRGVICIDTGCGKGGLLTGMVIEDGRYRLECSPGTLI